MMILSRSGGGADWWRGAAIYQVYPRSFCDSNGDGIGDLAGITSKLDHIARLNVDALWISPFYPSPQKDFGYDVSDYRSVDPQFGTLQDFDALLQRAHALGLKVLIDVVPSHTSDQHPWFLESRSSRDNPRARWYVWADPRPDGGPPSNWVSVFGGGAWQWDATRGQYYLHNFLVEQPDLNFHEPEVQQAILDVFRFWLDRGVDGFRIDVSNFLFHDAQLRDNPPAGDLTTRAENLPDDSPYGRQQHRYDKSQPENLAFLERVRALFDGYGDRTTLAEIADDDGVARMAEYTEASRRLHMAYSFHLLTRRCEPDFLRATLRDMEDRIGSGWPCWSLGNHDVARLRTRWAALGEDGAWLPTAMALLLSLRGSVCIYQGEELGLEEAEVAREDLQDPFGKANWPRYRGRDGCRTPMPWRSDAPQAGFSTAQRTWLPVWPPHRLRAVDVQEASPGSLLRTVRSLVAWRRAQPALRQGGALRWIDVPAAAVIAFERAGPDQRLACFFNLGPAPVELPRAGLPAMTRLHAPPGLDHGALGPTHLSLPPFGLALGDLG
jgi:alpha-glucosidase